MDKKDIKNTLNKIKLGNFDYSTLSDDDFEDIVGESIIMNYFECSTCSMSSRKRRPFDIVIEDNQKNVLKKNKTKYHYIECKNHKNKLNLDVMGRPLCIAIQDKPESVIFVNRYDELSPDAFEYTNWLFNSYLLKNVDFAIVTPENILNSKLFDDNNSEKIKNNSTFLITINNWSLYRENIFYEELECTNISHINSIYVDNSNYILKISLLFKNLNQRKINEIYLELKVNEIYENFNLLKKSKIIANTQEIYFNLKEVFNLVSNQAYELRLRIDSSSGSDVTERIHLPMIKSSNNIDLPDLRAKLSQKYSKILLEPNNNILFIKGEGGIGKSYFCEEICNNLKIEQNYKSHIYPMSSENSYAIFLDILYLYIKPENTKTTSTHFNQDYLESLTSLLGIKDINYSKIVESILNNNIEQETLEVIIRLIVDAISKSSNRKVLVFSNCQYMNNNIINSFKQFITALESKGWNKLKIFFEYRNTDEYYSTSWNDFESWINKNYSNFVKNVTLNPFSKEELYEWIDSSFIDDKKEYISKELLKKTGGNALFLTHLFEELKLKNIIRRISVDNSNYQLEITSLQEFKRNINKLPSNITALLIYRLNFIEKMFKKNGIFSELKYLIGIAAILDLKLYKEILLNIFALKSEEYSEIIRILVSKKIIKDSVNNENIFAHDMIRVSAKEFVKDDENLFDYYLKIIKIKNTKNQFELLTSKAKVSEFVNAYENAIKYYSQGYELAKHNESFQWQYKFANDELKLVKSNEIYLTNHKQKLFSLIDYVCWAEEHIGSYKNAVNIALEGISLLEEYSENSLIHIYPVFYHKIIGLSIELLNPKIFFDNILATIEYVEDITKLGQILNRVILQCFQSGYFEEGVKVSIIALKLAPQSTDNCVYSVLCTDISSLYSLIEPNHSLILCDKSLEMNVEERQMVHNKISQLSIKMKIDLNAIKKNELDNIKTVANKLKMNNVSTTLLNLEACTKIISHQFKYAINLLKDAEFKSSLYDHDGKNLQIINNLIICYTISNEFTQIERYLIKFYGILERFIGSIPSNAKDILNKLISNIEYRFIQKNKLEYDKTYLINKKYNNYVNLFTLYIHNIYEINKNIDNDKIKKITNEIILKLDINNQTNKINIDFFCFEKYKFFLSC